MGGAAGGRGGAVDRACHTTPARPHRNLQRDEQGAVERDSGLQSDQHVGRTVPSTAHCAASQDWRFSHFQFFLGIARLVLKALQWITTGFWIAVLVCCKEYLLAFVLDSLQSVSGRIFL